MVIIIGMKQQIVTAIFMILGVILATIGLKGFLIPNHFIDGGVTGLSMLLSQITEIPLYLMLLLVNLPFVVLGVFIMGWSLPLRGVVSILLLSISLQYLTIPAMTLEPILAALFWRPMFRRWNWNYDSIKFRLRWYRNLSTHFKSTLLSYRWRYYFRV